MAYSNRVMQPQISDLTTFARIRNAALEGFARDGVTATSIRDVAKAAGVSAGLVQHHFPTKATLTEAVNDHVISIAETAFANVPAARSTIDASDELGSRVTALIREHPDALRYVARASSEADPGALELFDTFVSIAEQQWEQLAKDDLLRADADRKWTALNTVMFNLAPLLFQTALDRHLPHPFESPEGLQRWQNAGTELFRHGVYQPD
jgi:TetR/AcrR family transcriptional regulator, regulator of cefoperazone and chloramphenicol sensitivity